VHQIRFRPGLRPEPCWSLQRSPNLLAGLRGLLLREGESRKGKGRGKEQEVPAPYANSRVCPCTSLCRDQGVLKYGGCTTAKNNVITGFLKSRFEHTHIFMDASATGRLEWCTAVCSLVLIAISLFLFIIFVNVVLSQRQGVVCSLQQFKCL